MNIANILTISRFFMTVFFVMAMMSLTLQGAVLALFLFLLAALTDLLDGYIARKYDLVTDLGKILDPLADKALVLSALVMLSLQGVIPGWMTGVVIFREAAVTIFRGVMLRSGRVLPAESSGKIKTVVQMTAIILALMFGVFRLWEPTAGWVMNYDSFLLRGINVMMMAAVVLTVWSGGMLLKRMGEKT